MRRALVRLAAGIFLLVAVTLGAEAQRPTNVPRIGFLSAADPKSAFGLVEAFRQGLREHGYVEGSNIAIEYRWAEGRFDRLPDLAAELIRHKVDIMVAAVTQASLAAKKSTTTTPIVMVATGDPVGAGLVASLGRPGGNITGTSSASPETAGKSLQFLREIAPKARRVAVLWNPANPVFQAQMVRETEAAARSSGLELRMFQARDAKEIDAAFATMATERVEVLNVLIDPVLNAHGTRIATLATKNRLPSVSGMRVYAEAGGLMAYGPSFPDLYRRAAVYVDKILKGAKPADLPVEQPTKFELIINMKTAKALSITIPPSLLIRADHVIE
jgi:putative ABC transport system substrate-binding protein